MKISFAISVQKTQFGAVAFGESLAVEMKTIKDLGYQGAELAIRDPQGVRRDELLGLVEELKLSVPAIGTGQAFVEEGLSLSHPDRAIREKTIARLKNHILLAQALGSMVIVGLIRGNLPSTEGAKREALQHFKEALAECSRFAEEREVKIVIEPLNRYEVNFLHTIEETLALIAELDLENVGILADTFHMNIEERDFAASLRLAKDRLWHFHVADSNRQAPGFGHLDFSLFFNTLEEIGYQGFISAEILQKPDFHSCATQTIRYLHNFIRYKEGEHDHSM